jgi:hypothetical protein
MAILTSASAIDIQPNQLVDGEYTDEHYKSSIKWVLSQYNQLSTSVNYLNNPSASTDSATFYIQEYLDNLTYIYGSQTPSNFSFFIQDVNGNNTRVPLFRGLDIWKIFQYVQGEAIDLIDPLPKILSANAYSIGAISAKKEMMDFVKYQIDSKVFLGLLQQEAGYGFKVLDRDFESKEKVDKFFETFQESMEVAYTRISKHVCYFNNYQNKLPKAFSNVFIGNLGCIVPEYRKGQVYWRVVQPENAIVDYSKGLDVHEDDDFGGEVYQMPLTQVLSEWEWTEDEISELQAIAKNDGGAYNNYYSAYATNNLFWVTNVNGVAKIVIGKAQWKSNERIDGVIKEVLREGTLIAGKFLKDQKISEGQVWSKGDVSKKRIKYITVTPNLFLGTSVSTVSIIKRIANLRDAFLTKVTEMASQPLGRVAIIRASKLPTGMRTPDVISQLKQAKVLVIEGEDTEEGDDGRKLAETLDLTIDPSIMSILQIAQYYENMISDVLNIPNQVRGQIADYSSKAQLQNSQNQSTKGLSYLFKNFLQFEKALLSYSADLFKLMAPEDEQYGMDSLSLIVGDGMAEMMSMDVIRQAQFEDFLINLNPNDYASEAVKQELAQVALQSASSGMSTKVLKNYIKVKQSDTLTEAYNYLEAEIFKEEKREDEQMLAQQEQQMAQAQLAAQTQKDIVANQTNTTMDKAELESDTKLGVAEINASKQNNSKPQPKK